MGPGASGALAPAGQGRTGQGRTGQDRTRQDRTGQDRAGQDRTGQDRTRPDRTGQDKAGQDRAGQDRRRQDRTGRAGLPVGYLGSGTPCRHQPRAVPSVQASTHMMPGLPVASCSRSARSSDLRPRPSRQLATLKPSPHPRASPTPG